MRPPGERVRADVLLWIVRYHASHGRGPSMREVAEAFGRKVGSMRDHLVKLRTLGFITWEANLSRTLKPLVSEVPISQPRLTSPRDLVE